MTRKRATNIQIDALRDSRGGLHIPAPAHDWAKPEDVILETEAHILRGVASLPEVQRRVNLYCGSPPSLGTFSWDFLDDPLVEAEFLNKPKLIFKMREYYGRDQTEGPRVRPHSGLLERFIALESATDVELQKFGALYGPLQSFYHLEDLEVIERRPYLVRTISEYCDVWRYLARSMKSLLSIAAQIQGLGSNVRSDWDVIGAYPIQMVVHSYVDSKRQGLKGIEETGNTRTDTFEAPSACAGEEEWLGLASNFRYAMVPRTNEIWLGLINALLAMGRTRPWLTWKDSVWERGPELVFSGPNLLSYLALQLCLVASRADAFAICSYCRRPYTPERAPKAGHPNYCPRCRREKIPGRIAQRARRNRLRETETRRRDG